MMNPEKIIRDVFDGKAFCRPLFYCYPGGLRFGLSDSGPAFQMVTTARQKAMRVCEDVFQNDSSLLLCLRGRLANKPFHHRETIRELRKAGITIPATRWLWLEQVEEDDWFDEDIPEWWLHLAFPLPVKLISHALWCAVTTEYPSIGPNPACDIYLFNLTREIMVFPYDDRGMDVVGPNHALLTELFVRHRALLLEHDMETMQQTFQHACKPRLV